VWLYIAGWRYVRHNYAYITCPLCLHCSTSSSLNLALMVASEPFSSLLCLLAGLFYSSIPRRFRSPQFSQTRRLPPPDPHHHHLHPAQRQGADHISRQPGSFRTSKLTAAATVFGFAKANPPTDSLCLDWLYLCLYSFYLIRVFVVSHSYIRYFSLLYLLILALVIVVLHPYISDVSCLHWSYLMLSTGMSSFISAHRTSLSITLSLKPPPTQ
jgi:hypothetical protein